MQKRKTSAADFYKLESTFDTKFWSHWYLFGRWKPFHHWLRTWENNILFAKKSPLCRDLWSCIMMIRAKKRSIYRYVQRWCLTNPFKRFNDAVWSASSNWKWSWESTWGTHSQWSTKNSALYTLVGESDKSSSAHVMIHERSGKPVDCHSTHMYVRFLYLP